eukprot:TRINITY_DN66109_c0_g1_i2.p1 TRINITY_DN66109_c0_g1~~TRINITY_DN66109_c0_g1_i2.p1  ORF type:complete len:312 (+),score=41.93 TRINITY_DN66109_c0_g1_i2:96-938(+)
MQKIGKLREVGFTAAELRQIAVKLQEDGVKCTIKDLTESLPKHLQEAGDEATVLILHGGAKHLLGDEGTADDMLKEQKKLVYDKKAKMHGRVVNKLARWNVCWGETSQEADYENGKGTVVAFDDCPLVKKVRETLPELLGSEKAKGLMAEGNHYYSTECGIGFHGDAERRITIGLRLGRTMPLRFQWLNNANAVAEPIDFHFQHGDVYVMSEKATGCDWRKQQGKHVHLRHAAGNAKYLTWKPKAKKATKEGNKTKLPSSKKRPAEVKTGNRLKQAKKKA